jgi:hypothetical protein
MQPCCTQRCCNRVIPLYHGALCMWCCARRACMVLPATCQKIPQWVLIVMLQAYMCNGTACRLKSSALTECRCYGIHLLLVTIACALFNLINKTPRRELAQTL